MFLLILRPLNGYIMFLLTRKSNANQTETVGDKTIFLHSAARIKKLQNIGRFPIKNQKCGSQQDVLLELIVDVLVVFCFYQES